VALNRCKTWVWEHHVLENKILMVSGTQNLCCVCWSCFSICPLFICCFLLCLGFFRNWCKHGFIQSFWKGQAGSVGLQQDQAIGKEVLPKYYSNLDEQNWSPEVSVSVPRGWYILWLGGISQCDTSLLQFPNCKIDSTATSVKGTLEAWDDCVSTEKSHEKVC